jgi:hypothetical protein
MAARRSCHDHHRRPRHHHLPLPPAACLNLAKEHAAGGMPFKAIQLVHGYAATFSNARPSQKRFLPIWISAESAQELERLTAWTRGRLIIAPGETLGELVRELNRYHHRKIVLEDPSL